MTVPMLQTARMTLGPVSLPHFEAFAAFCASDRSAFLGGPGDRRDAWDSCAIHAGQWALRGYGTFWLTETASGLPAGRVGIWHPEGLAEPELSWVIFDGFEGRGLAHEAAIAARAWAHASRGLARLQSLIAPDNTRSAALARRLGAVPEGTHAYAHGKTVTRWRHPGPEAAA